MPLYETKPPESVLPAARASAVPVVAVAAVAAAAVVVVVVVVVAVVAAVVVVVVPEETPRPRLTCVDVSLGEASPTQPSGGGVHGRRISSDLCFRFEFLCACVYNVFLCLRA